MTTHKYPVRGMSCASCSAHVDKALRSVNGVSEVNVNLATNMAKVTFDEAQCTPLQLQKAVSDMGFELLIDQEVNEPTNSATSHAENEPTTISKSMAIGALAVAIPLLVLSIVPGLFAGQEVALFFLSSYSLYKYGRIFYSSAFKLLKHGTSNMDTLVALSISVSYVYSCANLFFPQWFTAHGMQPHLYFDSVGVITAFILLGRMLEARAKGRTTKAIKDLIGLQPKQVTIVFPNGTQHVKTIDKVKVGDVLLARPGERLAADGTVVEGCSNVDESMISGEPLAVSKEVGSKVIAGTINKNGTLRYRAEHTKGDTLLGQIINMVQDAQGSKVPVQHMVDRIAAVFVPVIMGIAIMSLLAWLLLSPTNGLTHGLIAMVSVLVIACPCSLGLATPTAIIVGIGRGAAQGILIKDANCLQSARHIDSILLDKTGTLTIGHPQVTDSFYGDNSELYRSVLLSIEYESEHPLAEAICHSLKNVERKPVINFCKIEAGGIQGDVNGCTYYIGSPTLMQQKKCNFTAITQKLVHEWEAKAATVVCLAHSNKVVAIVAICDSLKSTSVQAVKALTQMGITPYMLTGDNEATAQTVAAQVNIKHYKAHLLPADKANFVRQLQAEGHHVAMVGDGINDSAALAQADLSIAMGRGSDTAINSAMITLLTSDLSRLPQAIHLSQRTMRTIQQNLFWAFIYNVVSVPIAAGVLYPICGFMLSPMIAGAAMALSSVSVVTNSLRLRSGKL